MRLCKTEECVSCWRGSKNGHGENWFVMTPVCTSSDSGKQAADPVKCQSIMSPFKWIVFTLRSSSCFWRIVFSIPFKCAVVKEIHAASTDDWAQQPYFSVHAPLNQIIFHVMPCHPKQLDYNRPFKPPNCISTLLLSEIGWISIKYWGHDLTDNGQSRADRYVDSSYTRWCSARVIHSFIHWTKTGIQFEYFVYEERMTSTWKEINKSDWVWAQCPNNILIQRYQSFNVVGVRFAYKQTNKHIIDMYSWHAIDCLPIIVNISLLNQIHTQTHD